MFFMFQYTSEYVGLFKEAGLPPKRKLTRFLVTENAAIQPGKVDFSVIALYIYMCLLKHEHVTLSSMLLSCVHFRAIFGVLKSLQWFFCKNDVFFSHFQVQFTYVFAYGRKGTCVNRKQDFY